jgi:hypothetical protein
VDYFSAYKTIRNKLRKFAPQSVVECALNVLWTPHENKVEMLKQAPWQTLLLVKWALINRQASDRTGERLSKEKFDAIRQSLWDLPEAVRRVEGQSLELFMRQITYQQMEFQRSETPVFARQPALLGALDQNHPLRRMFHETTGLDVLDFLDLSLATYSAIIGGQRLIPLGWFEPLRKCYGTAVDAYIRAISVNYVELRDFLRSQPDANQRWISEYFEFTPIKRYPLFRQGEIFQAWHPMVFSRGIETFVHAVLSEVDAEDYMGQYSKIFEEHVIDLIRKTGRPFLDENNIRTIIGRKASVSEALMPMVGGNLIIEAKAGVFGEPVMSVGDPAFLARRVQPLAKAIAQARSVASKIYGSDKCPEVARSNKRNFLIVVTNRLLNISRGTRLQALCGSDLLEESQAVEQYLPLENIYFVGIDEFEHFMVACLDNSFDPIQFLEESVARDANPATATFYFGDHFARVKGVDLKGRFSIAAINAAEKRLTAALDGNQRGLGQAASSPIAPDNA